MADLNIVDMSGAYPGLVKGQLGNVQGLVVHHTATPDTATPQSIAQGWLQDGNSSQFIMGRDGTIYQMMPSGSKAYQVIPSWNPQIPWANNSTTEGIELIAKDDSDVTPAQTAALQQFALQQAQQYGFDPATNVIGHGEINGAGAPAGTNPTYLRQPTEGMTAVNDLRSYLKANPSIEAQYSPAVAAINQVAPTPIATPSAMGLGYTDQPPANSMGTDYSQFYGNAPGSGPGTAITELQNPTGSQPTPNLVRLASGKMIAPGTYGDTQVSDDGNGNAVVTVMRNPLAAGPGTIVGGIAAQKIGQVAQQAGQTIGGGLSALGSNVAGAAGNVASGAQGLIQSGLGALGNFFGGSGSQSQPTGLGALPSPSTGSFNSNGTPYTGANPEKVSVLGYSAPAPQTYQQANPAYAAWLAQYGNGTANQSGSPDDRDSTAGAIASDQGDTPAGWTNTAANAYGLAALPPAPPKMITVTKPAVALPQQQKSQPSYVQGSSVDSQGYYFNPSGNGQLLNVNWSN